MTLTMPQLINKLLIRLRFDYYQGADKQWFRDKKALIRAILTYGYECNQRGWLFNEGQIWKELSTLFEKIKNRDMEITHLPTYLHYAILNHIGVRAEELSAEAKRTARRAPDLIKGVQGVVAVVQPSAVELMSAVYLVQKKKPKQKIIERQKELI